MSKEDKIQKAQAYLKEMGVDGWLLYDFHRNNELAHFFLEISKEKMVTRRFFYWIPVQGEPIKIVHAIESDVLDKWPGQKRTFLSWQSLEKEIGAVVKGAKKIAMEYSPKNAIPYVSKVDGGTIDLIRSFGIEVVSSGNFLLQFTAVIDEAQGKSHLRAATELDSIVKDTWQWIGKHLKQGKELSEYDVQQKILADFKQKKLVTHSSPTVGVNAHSADPHYEPQKKGSSPIRKGDFILIDLWAKEADERAVWGDITRVAVAAEKPTAKQQEVFQIVRKAQKAAIDLIKERFSKKQRIEGWEVDDAVRNVIVNAGYGDRFIHRTGHSIEVEVHGSGTHMDNLEMHDVRPLLPGTCFSVEPGIYLTGEFGVRLESDVYIDLSGKVQVTGGEEDELICLF